MGEEAQGLLAQTPEDLVDHWNGPVATSGGAAIQGIDFLACTISCVSEGV